MATYEVTFKAVIEIPFGSPQDEIADEARRLISRPDFEPFEIDLFDELDD